MSAGGQQQRHRLIYGPRPVRVSAGKGRAPDVVEGRTVEAIHEEWLVEDRWWSAQPLRRHYYELVLLDGSDIVVFRDLETGTWFRQRA